MHRRPIATTSLSLFAVAGIAATGTAQQERLVPSQYATVEAAVAAANDGDRVILDGSTNPIQATVSGNGDLVINKSISVIGSPGRAAIPITNTSNSAGPNYGRLLIGSTSRALQVTMENIEVTFVQDPMQTDATFGVQSVYGPVPTSEIRMRNVLIHGGGQMPFASYPPLMLDITADRVWMRDCAVYGYVGHPDNPCPDWTSSPCGSDAAHITATTMVLENCDFEGGDSGHFNYYGPCNPPQENCPGGVGLRATTAVSVLTRVTLRDGNSAWFQPGPWLPFTLLPAATSQLVGPTGQLFAWDVVHYTGYPGRIAATRPNGPASTAFIGDNAHLTLGGSLQPGGTLTLAVDNFSNNYVAVVLAGTPQLTPTPLGPLLLDLSSTLTTFWLPLQAWNCTIQIPMATQLVGAPLAAQVVELVYSNSPPYTISVSGGNVSSGWLTR